MLTLQNLYCAPSYILLQSWCQGDALIHNWHLVHIVGQVNTLGLTLTMTEESPVVPFQLQCIFLTKFSSQHRHRQLTASYRDQTRFSGLSSTCMHTHTHTHTPPTQLNNKSKILFQTTWKVIKLLDSRKLSHKTLRHIITLSVRVKLNGPVNHLERKIPMRESIYPIVSEMV